MSDFPFSIPRRGDADVVTGVSYSGSTLTLQRTTGADLTTTIATAPPFEYKQSDLNGGDYIYTVPVWDKTLTTTEIEIDAISPLNITPTSASQKVVLQVSVLGEWSVAPNKSNISLKRIVGSTETWLDPRADSIFNKMPVNGIFSIPYDLADTQNTPETCNFTYVDDPNTTSQVTYKVYLKTAQAQDFYLNRTVRDLNQNFMERGKSTFIVECKG